MRIGFNLLYRGPIAGGGVETYVCRLIDEIIRLDKKNDYVLFVSNTASLFPVPKDRSLAVVSCAVDASKRGTRYGWEQMVLPVQVWKHKIQMLHSMNYVSPVICPCKTVVTLPDLSYRESSVHMTATRRVALTLFSSLSAHNTDAVVTVSEFSKRSICSSLRLGEDRVRVVPSGPGWNSERPSQRDIERTTAKYRIAPPYVVAFAGGYAHKNIPRMLKVFQAVCKDLPHKLVLIGNLPPNVELTPPLVEEKFRSRIHHVGYIPTEDVYPILGGSDLFVFPSLYEGFGFPLLEAQMAGVAIACSNVSSIPEVAGDGAAYFDPFSIESMCGTIRRCLSDPAMRARLVLAGFENVNRFSWTEAAKSYIELYNELAN